MFTHQCTYCQKHYSKKNFNFCPYCGGDADARTPKVWRPTKRQKKEYTQRVRREQI